QSLLNQLSEGRTSDEVAEHIRAIALATDMVYHSLSEGKYLYELVNQPDSLTVNDQSVIRHILVVDAEGKVYDSTTEKDIGKPFNQVAEDAPPFSSGDLKGDADEISNKQSRSLHFSITTSIKNPKTGEQESTKRHIYIIISLNRLTQVKEAGDR